MKRQHIALMRGINVGGKNKLPMQELAAIFEEAGCVSVRTYIQSGNVVFEADQELVDELAEDVPRRIQGRFGLLVPVVLRTADALRRIVARNPFVGEDTDPKHLHVGFLAEAPGAEAVASLDPVRSNVDSFAVLDAEVYLHVPGGMGRTKLTTDWFDRRLGTVMTVRNWRTVNALVEMATGD